MPAYQTYFDNFFATLPMSRVNFKALGASTLAALREANLGKEFAPHEAALQAALAGFDENLTEAGASTGGGSAAFRAARTAWLAFVDDTMKDYVTPKLRKLPVYADFKKYNKSKLAELAQPELLQESKQLLALYAAHAADMKHEALPAEAQAVYEQLTAADASRDKADATISQARVALSADWAAVALALYRLKSQLHLRFNEPEQVYRFFDFSKVRPSGKRKKTPAAPAVSVV